MSNRKRECGPFIEEGGKSRAFLGLTLAHKSIIICFRKIKILSAYILPGLFLEVEGEEQNHLSIIIGVNDICEEQQERSALIIALNGLS